MKTATTTAVQTVVCCRKYYPKYKYVLLANIVLWLGLVGFLWCFFVGLFLDNKYQVVCWQKETSNLPSAVRSASESQSQATGNLSTHFLFLFTKEYRNHEPTLEKVKVAKCSSTPNEACAHFS